MKRFGFSPSRRPVRHGFTLMELLVVIGVIALVAAVAVPSIRSIFTAGTNVQAYNLMAAQLTAARSLAMETSDYAAAHVQLGDPTNDELRGRSYAALFTFSGSEFVAATGYEAQRIPGTMAFGELSDSFIATGGNFQGVSGDVTTASSGLSDFTSFTVVFGATGEAVRQIHKVDDGKVHFATSGAAGAYFTSGSHDRLWDPVTANQGSAGEPPYAAMCLFDMSEIQTGTDAFRHEYLDDNAEFLPVNVHSGQLFPRR